MYNHDVLDPFSFILNIFAHLYPLPIFPRLSHYRSVYHSHFLPLYLSTVSAYHQPLHCVVLIIAYPAL